METRNFTTPNNIQTISNTVFSSAKFYTSKELGLIEDKSLAMLYTKTKVFAPNSLVLVKLNAKGDVSRVCNVGQIEGATTLFKVIRELTKYTLAEFRAVKAFEAKYKDATGVTIKKNVLISPFLQTRTVLTTDDEGRINEDLTLTLSSDKPTLANTALKIERTHKLVTVEPKNFKAAMYNHCQAIESQFNFGTKLVAEIIAIETECRKESAPKVAPTTTVDETKEKEKLAQIAADNKATKKANKPTK